VQFEAISLAKIEQYIQAKQEEARNPRPPTPSGEEGSGKRPQATSARDSKASTQVCASTPCLCTVEASSETGLLRVGLQVQTTSTIF